MAKVWGYTRVSSQDQVDNGASLLAQERQIAQKYMSMRAEGYTELVMLRDEGVSAYSLNIDQRPEGKKLIAGVKPGDCVILASLDRAFRSQLDGLQTIKYLERHSVHLVFLNLNGKPIDSRNPIEKMAISMMLMFAEYESATKATRKNASLDYKEQVLGFAQMPPVGFRHKKGWKTMRVDPHQIDVAKQMLMGWYTGRLVGFWGVVLKHQWALGCRHYQPVKRQDLRNCYTDNSKAQYATKAFQSALCCLANTGALCSWAAEAGFTCPMPRRHQIRIEGIGVVGIISYTAEGKLELYEYATRYATPRLRPADCPIGEFLPQRPVRARWPDHPQLLARKDIDNRQPAGSVAGASEAGQSAA